MAAAWILTVVKMAVVLTVLCLAGAQWKVLSVALALNAVVMLLYWRSGRAAGYPHAPRVLGSGSVLTMHRRGRKGFQRLKGDGHADPDEVEVDVGVGIGVEGEAIAIAEAAARVAGAVSLGQEAKVHTV